MPLTVLDYLLTGHLVLDLFDPGRGGAGVSMAGPGGSGAARGNPAAATDSPAANPTVVFTTETERFGLSPERPVVVWGWGVLRRLEAAGAQSVYAEERPLAPRKALYVALVLEGRGGSYTWQEMERIVDYGYSHAVEIDTRVSEAVSGDGGLLPRVERYRKLWPEIQDALNRDEVDLKTAEALQRGLRTRGPEEADPEEADPEETGKARQAARGLLSVARPASYSNRRKLLGLARDLLLGRRLDLRALESLVTGYRDDPAGLLSDLRSRRFPELTSMEGELAGFVDAHLKGSGVRLEAPPNFEGRRFTVSFDFADKAEYLSRLAALEGAGDNLEQILDLL